ncbi:MAG: nuclear transport factor 2 family protein [Flavobacteriales bacterium]|nr:nuclear transport factor 2 family protein [Flavobacteriales bacterium]
MRTFVLFTSALCICACERSTPPAISLITADDERSLRHLKEVQWPQAYRTQDTVLLDNILHEDFEMIDAEGNVFRKADEIAWVKSNTWRVDSFRYEIKRLATWPNGTAIVSGIGHMLSDSVTHTYWSSNVFVKTDGRWRAVSSHVSGVKAMAR